MLPVPDSVNKFTYSSTKTSFSASTVPLQNDLSTLFLSSNTVVQLAGYSLVWVWSRDHHLNLCLKRTCLSKGDSPQKDIEGDTYLLTTPSNSVLHDQDLWSVIFSYLSFPKRSKLSCVNKDWQRASTNHKAFTINLTAFGMKLHNVLKFVGKRFNILKKITLNFTVGKSICTRLDLMGIRVLALWGLGEQ